MTAIKRIISGLLVASFLLSACGSSNQGETESYTSKSEKGKMMQLVNFIGDTILSNEDGDNAPDLDLLPLNLYSGDSLETRTDSHIAVDLDQYKHITLDEKTKASIEEAEDGMTISVDEGGVFFVTTKKVEKGEFYKFKNSNVTCATLGTMGVFRTVNDTDTVIMIFEGRVEGEAGKDKEAFSVSTGELVAIHTQEDESAEVSKREIMITDVDNFVKNEIGQSEGYAKQLLDNGGKAFADYLQLNDLEVQKDLYKSVIDAYSEMIYKGNEGPEIEQLEFQTKTNAHVKEYYFPKYPDAPRNYSYTFYDVNGDGIKEFLIALDKDITSNNQEKHELFDIWTIKDNRPVHLINEIYSNEMEICENSVVSYSYQEGNEPTIVYFKMDMNNSLNYADILSTDAESLVCHRHTGLDNNLSLMDLYNAILADKNNSNVITKEEYDSIKSSYKTVTNITGWKAIEPPSDYQEPVAQWKEIYRDYFMSNEGRETVSEFSKYRLIYLDDDEIPELVLSDDDLYNVSFAYIDSNDNVALTGINNNSSWYIEPGSGKIITYRAHQSESCWMSLLKNHKFEDFYVDLGGSDSGMTTYEWRGKKVSTDEYYDSWKNELDETKVLKLVNSTEGFSLSKDILDEFQ